LVNPTERDGGKKRARQKRECFGVVARFVERGLTSGLRRSK